jgi:Gas vesicle synthesis protein GvpL/GvpF
VAWYVFALVDAVPSGRAGRGLTGALSIRKLAGAFVVVERRADVPPVELGSLKKHHDVVARLATQVPAILPVRFGTLLEPEHLEEAGQERDEEILEALDFVRDRVQFTWRIKGRQKAEGRRQEEGQSVVKAVTGTAYLRQVALAANPALPAAFRALGSKLAPLIAGQRYQPGKAALPEAVYHLVEKKKVRRYVAAAAVLRKSRPLLSMTGPWPPFAFAPEIL